MPKIGSLWVWFGNNYTVIDAFNGRILLAELGSGDWATQVYDDILGWLPLVSLAKVQPCGECLLEMEAGIWVRFWHCGGCILIEEHGSGAEFYQNFDRETGWSEPFQLPDEGPFSGLF